MNAFDRAYPQRTSRDPKSDGWDPNPDAEHDKVWLGGELFVELPASSTSPRLRDFYLPDRPKDLEEFLRWADSFYHGPLVPSGDNGFIVDRDHVGYDPLPAVFAFSFQMGWCHATETYKTAHGNFRPAWDAEVTTASFLTPAGPDARSDVFNPSLTWDRGGRPGSGTTMKVVVIGGDGSHRSGTAMWAVYDESGPRDEDNNKWVGFSHGRRTAFYGTRKEALMAFLPIHNRERHDAFIKMVAEIAARDEEARLARIERRKKQQVLDVAPQMLEILVELDKWFTKVGPDAPGDGIAPTSDDLTIAKAIRNIVDRATAPIDEDSS